MAKPELINFIKSSRARGVSNNDIKKILIQKGWDAKDVNEALATKVGAGSKVLDYVKNYSAKGYSRQEITATLLKSGVARSEIDKAFSSVGSVGGAKPVSKSAPFYKSAGFLIGIALIVLLIVFGTLGFVLYGMFAGEEPDSSDCMSDRDCGSGYECTAGVCVYVGEESECDSDSDCSDGYECSGGDCVYVGSSSECIVDSDCGTGYSCDSGSCVVDTSACGSDSDCDSGEECVDGDCVEEADSPDVNCTGACSGSCPGSCSGTETFSGVTYYSNIEVLDVTLGGQSNWEAFEFNINWNNSGEAKFGDDWHISCSFYNSTGFVDMDKKKVSDYFGAGEDYNVDCDLNLNSYISNMPYLDDVEMIVTMDMYDNITESNETDNNFTYSATWNRSELEAGFLPAVDCNYMLVQGSNLTINGYNVVVNEVWADVNVSVDNVSASLSTGSSVVNGLDVEIVSFSPTYVNLTLGGRGSCPVAGVECTLNSDCTFVYEGCIMGQCVWVGVNAAIPSCSNLVDDDFDGACDYAGCDIDGDGVNEPSDPGCANANDDDERSACYDFWDNDDDGFCDAGGCIVNDVYLPADVGCFGASDDDEYNECFVHDDCVGNANGEFCSPVDYVCVECLYGDNCIAPNNACVDYTCVECTQDSHCPNSFCDLTTNFCSANDCAEDEHCDDGYVCESGNCEVSECNDGFDNDYDGFMDYFGGCQYETYVWVSCESLGATTSTDCWNECEYFGDSIGTYLQPDTSSCSSLKDNNEANCDSDADCVVVGEVCNYYGQCTESDCNDGIDNDDDCAEYDYPCILGGIDYFGACAYDPYGTGDYSRLYSCTEDLEVDPSEPAGWFNCDGVCEQWDENIPDNSLGDYLYIRPDSKCSNIEDDDEESDPLIPDAAEVFVQPGFAPEQETSFIMKLWNAIWFSEPVDLWNFEN